MSEASQPEADSMMAARIAPEVIEDVVALIPDTWLAGETELGGSDAYREAYTRYLAGRLESPRSFVEEAIRARSLRV